MGIVVKFFEVINRCIVTSFCAESPMKEIFEQKRKEVARGSKAQDTGDTKNEVYSKKRQ